MASLSLLKWQNSKTFGANLAGGMIRVHPYALETALQWFKLYISNMYVMSGMRSGFQPQTWCNCIVSTPQVTYNSQIWGQLCQWNDKGAPIYPWDSIPKTQTIFICLIWMYEVDWGSYWYQPQTLHNVTISTPQMTQIYQIWGKRLVSVSWWVWRVRFSKKSVLKDLH